MSKHIGIVAVSPEGAAIFYREIFRQAKRHIAEPHEHPRVTLHSEPLAQYIDRVRAGDWHAVAELLQRSANHLAHCGAHFCLSPDNAVQHAVHLAQSGSPIPWLTMPELVAHAVEADSRKTVGLIGTRWVTMASTYQTHLGLKGTKVVVPPAHEAEELDAIILNELIYGFIQESSRAKVQLTINRLADQGAEAVILASSEIPLVVTTANCSLPIYDAGEILARSAVQRAIENA